MYSKTAFFKQVPSDHTNFHWKPILVSSLKTGQATLIGRSLLAALQILLSPNIEVGRVDSIRVCVVLAGWVWKKGKAFDVI